MLSVAGAGRIVNVGDMLKVMMNDVVMRASVGDRCVQRDAYLEELDRVLDLMSGFNLIDLFPASRLVRAIGGRALGATWEVHRRIHSIMDAMISDHRTAMEGEDDNDAGCEQRGDILTTLLRFQMDGGIGGVALTNENISGVLFVSHQSPLATQDHGLKLDPLIWRPSTGRVGILMTVLVGHGGSIFIRAWHFLE